MEKILADLAVLQAASKLYLLCQHAVLDDLRLDEQQRTKMKALTARVGKHVAVHATGEPGALYAAKAGVVSIDHAYQLSEETMRLMKEKRIFAVPTFAISEYFAEHLDTPEQRRKDALLQELHAQEFRKQVAAGVPMAVGSDVGPFPHGTQAREFVLMVKYGMKPLAVLQAERNEEITGGRGGNQREVEEVPLGVKEIVCKEDHRQRKRAYTRQRPVEKENAYQENKVSRTGENHGPKRGS